MQFKARLLFFMLVFYFLAGIVLWLGILSVRSGFRFARYVREQHEIALPEFHPFASVIAPCRGIDQGLQENLTALLQQNYPAYEVIIVTDDAADPAVCEIESVKARSRGNANLNTRLIVAGAATDSGQKVHNLRIASTQISSKSEVLVFVDSDARPGPDWLRSLVAPLAKESLGATTGYRWFIPVAGGFWSHLRSVWNASIASALGPQMQSNFCWGGSTAIRRSLFEELKVAARWKGTISDDFTLTRTLQQAGWPIHFVPACLVPSFEDCSFSELLEFSNRQLKITRVYAPHLWKPLLIGSLLFVIVFFGGLMLLVASMARGFVPWLLVVLLAMIFLLGVVKAYIRFRAIVIPMERYRAQLKKSFHAHLWLWPIASFLYLVNALVAAFSRRIEWRGITYQLKSPNEAVIIARDNR